MVTRKLVVSFPSTKAELMEVNVQINKVRSFLIAIVIKSIIRIKVWPETKVQRHLVMTIKRNFINIHIY